MAQPARALSSGQLGGTLLDDLMGSPGPSRRLTLPILDDLAGSPDGAVARSRGHEGAARRGSEPRPGGAMRTRGHEGAERSRGQEGASRPAAIRAARSPAFSGPPNEDNDRHDT